jgi:hypothetical protein
VQHWAAHAEEKAIYSQGFTRGAANFNRESRDGKTLESLLSAHLVCFQFEGKSRIHTREIQKRLTRNKVRYLATSPHLTIHGSDDADTSARNKFMPFAVAEIAEMVVTLIRMG